MEVSPNLEQALSWSPDGRLIAVAGERPTVVTVVDPGSGRRSTLRPWPSREATAPAGWLRGRRFLLPTFVATDDRELVVMKADGTRRTVLTRDRVQDFDPAPSPDGRAVAFASIRKGRRLVYVRSASGRERRLVARRIDGQGSPAWSPDGRELAIEADGAIYVVSAVGGPPRRLVAGGEAAWSPDGKRLAFFGAVGGRFGIWEIGRDGRGLRYVGGWRQPSFSPDGAHIAFQRPRTNEANAIYVMDLHGAEVRLVTPHGRNPAWAPDGRTIVFDTRDAIWAVDSNAANLRRLTDERGINESPAWMRAA